MLPLSTRLVVVVLVSEPSGTRWFGPVSKRLPSRATEDGQRVKERMVEYGVGRARSAQDDARCSPSDDRTFSGGSDRKMVWWYYFTVVVVGGIKERKGSRSVREDL